MPTITPTDHALQVDLTGSSPGMTKEQIDQYLEDSLGGFTTEELSAAFDTVKDAEHWKGPIDAIVDRTMTNILTHAIPYYTGTGAEFEDVDGQPDKTRVTAAGYWGGPCN